MSITSEVRNDLIALVVGMYQAAPGTAQLTSLVETYNSNRSMAALAKGLESTAEFKAAYPVFLSNVEFATRVVDNILEGRVAAADRTWAIDTLVAALNKGDGRAELILTAVIELQKTTNTAWANAKAAFLNQVDVATYHTVTLEKAGTLEERKAVIADVDQNAASVTTAKAAVAVVAGTTLLLTTGLDTGSAFTGKAGNDTFVGVDTQNATTQTLTAGDSLSGGAGTDTLRVSASGGAVIAAPLVSTNGIEALSVTNNNTGLYTIDASQMSGLTSVELVAGASAVSVINQTSILNASLSSTVRDLTLTPAATAVAGLSDAMSLSVNGVAKSASSTVTVNGIETVNVSSTGTGAGDATADTRLAIVSTALDNVNVEGAAAARLTVNFAGSTGTEVATLNASTSTGGVDATITLGTSGNLRATGGSGNDTFTVGAITATQTIVGGEGSDTLVVASATAATSGTQPGAGVSGFETLGVANAGTADLRAFSANTGFTKLVAEGATGTFAGLGTAAAVVDLKATGGTVGVTRATDGAADSIALSLVAATPGTFTAVNVVDEETITLASRGTALGDNTITTLAATDATSITVTGDRSLTVTNLTGATALATLNAGGHTGSVFSINASNSGANMTVTGSAGSQATVGAAVNTITTGTGNDSITGGNFRDVLTGGIGNDTINGGEGNDALTGDTGNDVIDGGLGDDLVVGDQGNDSLTGGAGNDTINAGVGNDTVSGGDGNDAIYVTSLNDEDSIDGGALTDTLSASAPTTTGAGPTAPQYTDIIDSVVAKITGVETGYIQITTTGTNTTAATALTANFAGVTGMSTLWLDVNDGTTDGDEFIVLRDFGGSTINLTGLASATDSNPQSLTLDGIGQAALTVNVRSYATGATEATVFTGVEAVTVSGTSVINSANITNVLGDITANSASSVTLRTSGSTISAANTNALTVNSLTANNTQTVATNAGAYDSLVVTTTISSNGGLVQTLDIDGGASSITNIDGGAYTLTGSTVRTATVDLLADAQLYDNADTNTVDVTATALTGLTVNLASNSRLSLDLNANVTTGTVAMSSGSSWNVNTIGGAGVSSVTLTGTGDVDSGRTATVIAPGIQLVGTTVTFNAGGLTDADSLSISSTATVASTITLPLTATGAGEVSSGAGADSLTGGNGADRFGLTGRVETFTVANVTDTTDTFNAVINGVTTATSVTAAGNNTSAATGIAAAINATSATSFATATATDAVVTVTYAQYFGTAGAVAVVVDAAGGNNVGTLAVTAAGDNAGADTISGGVGADTIIGGTGADRLSGGTGADHFVFLTATDSAATIAADTVRTFDVITDFTTTSDKISVALLADVLAGGNATGVTVTTITTTTLGTTSIATFGALATAVNAVGLVASAAGGAGANTGLQAYLIDLTGNTGALGAAKYLVLNNNNTTLTAADTMIELTGTTTTVVAGDFVI